MLSNESCSAMVNPSVPGSKGRNWGKKVKFWKHQRVRTSTDRPDGSTLIANEYDDQSGGVGASTSSQYSSAESLSKESSESPPAIKISWSFPGALVGVVQSIEEATEDAKLFGDNAQQAIADVVKSFDYSSGEEGKDSLAGETHYGVAMNDHVSVPMSPNCTLEVSDILNRQQSSANESVDEIARAVRTANRAVQSKSIASSHGTIANKSVNSNCSGHNSRASRKSGRPSKGSSRSISHSSQTTEELSPSVQLVTEFSVADDIDDQDRQSRAPDYGEESQSILPRTRSVGSSSLWSSLVGHKKKGISESDKMSRTKLFGGKRANYNSGADHSSMNHDSSTSTAISSVTQGAHPDIVSRDVSRQKVRREAIVRELVDDDNTSQSFDETYDGTIETYDGTLDTYDDTLATPPVGTTGGGEGNQNATSQLLEHFGSMFCCVGLCGQKKLAQARHVETNEDRSCFGATQIFSDDGTFDNDTHGDGTYNGTLDNGTYDGTDDNGTYDGTFDGTYDHGFTENGTVETGTHECDSFGTYDETFDGTLETATDDDTFNDTVNAESCGYEANNSPGRQIKFTGESTSDRSEVSSLADQSHIYMMMTNSRREKSEIPKEISKKPSGAHKTDARSFRRAVSAFNSFKTVVSNTGDRKSSSKHLDRGILARIQVSPTSRSEPHIADEPKTTNPISASASIQKEWLRAIGDCIHKQGDDTSKITRYSRGTMTRRAAAEEALKRIRRNATRINKFAQ